MPQRFPLVPSFSGQSVNLSDSRILIRRGETVTLYMDPAGDDTLLGLSPASAVASGTGLGRLLRRYRFEGFNGAINDSTPRINVVMVAAGTYNGGELDGAALGSGYISINDTNVSGVVFGTGWYIHDFGAQTQIVMRQPEFSVAGVEYFAPYQSYQQNNNGGNTAQGYFALNMIRNNVVNVFQYSSWDDFSLYVSNAEVRVLNGTYSPGTGGQVPLVVADVNGIIRLDGGTISVENPFIYIIRGGSVSASFISFSYPSPTSLRYLAHVGYGGVFEIDAIQSSTNLTLLYLVRADPGASIVASQSVANNVTGGFIDNEANQGGVNVNVRNTASAQSLPHRTELRNASANFGVYFAMGMNQIFYGTGVQFDCGVFSGFSDTDAVRGMTFKASVVDGANIVVTLTGGGLFFINGNSVAGGTVLNGASGTSIEVEHIAENAVKVTVLEGMLI